MRKRTKRILATLAALFFIALGATAWWIHPLLEMGAAYKAKVVGSAIFVSKRPAHAVLAEDVHAGNLHLLDLFRTDIDYEQRTVTTSFNGFVKRTAVFREGIGVSLALGIPIEALREETRPPPGLPPANPDRLWPAGSRVDTSTSPAGIDEVKLFQTVTAAFAEPDPEHLLRARAVVVVFDGKIIAEKYAQGFSHDTPLAGWSMTKSVTNALVGILVRKGELGLDDDALLAEWNAPGDPRAAIVLDDLLRMSSGLGFIENYEDPRKDVTTMLFRVGDASGFAAAKRLEAEPGTRWGYASGTTNIVCRIIRETLADDSVYHAFPYHELFHRIGMTSATLERDASGTFVGSSFMFASARDWARLGLLYANDGTWNGERVLPEGWVEYSRTPAPGAPKSIYGAHFWLRIDQDPSDLGKERILPEGAFHMSGHEGQFVTILPEKKLVVVRLGLTLHSGAWDHEKFVADILAALPGIVIPSGVEGPLKSPYDSRQFGKAPPSPRASSD